MLTSERAMKITPLGDSAVLIEVGSDPAKVRSLGEALGDGKQAGITDVVAAYANIAVYYDPVAWSDSGAAKPFEAVCKWILDTVKTVGRAKAHAGRERKIPVCYGGDHGPDLAAMALAKGLPESEVVRLHSSATYEVRAIGFSPGFPYLAGLPEALHMPRKASPRAVVPAGSVGIGGAQTGIYTLDTPGGWHLLGRTPLRLFCPERDEPALLKVGDLVRFDPVTPEEYGRMIP